MCEGRVLTLGHHSWDMVQLVINLVVFISLCSRTTFGFNEIHKKINDGDVKLVDGGSKKEGTVLVYRGYGWGSICDDHWTINEANVICHQLGMEKAIQYYTRNYFQTHGISKSLIFIPMWTNVYMRKFILVILGYDVMYRGDMAIILLSNSIAYTW